MTVGIARFPSKMTDLDQEHFDNARAALLETLDGDTAATGDFLDGWLHTVEDKRTSSTNYATEHRIVAVGTTRTGALAAIVDRPFSLHPTPEIWIGEQVRSHNGEPTFWIQAQRSAESHPSKRKVVHHWSTDDTTLYITPPEGAEQERATPYTLSDPRDWIGVLGVLNWLKVDPYTGFDSRLACLVRHTGVGGREHHPNS